MVSAAVESLGTFGEVEDEQELDELGAPPIPFTLVGYETKKGPDGKHKRREFTFSVRPTAGFGPLFNVLHHVDDNGKIPEQVAARFLYAALIADDQPRFTKTLDDPSVEFRAELLGEFAMRLGERYGLRPTQPRSARRSGPRRTGTTSTAGRSRKASTSKRVTPRTRSTSSTR
jgi:hypothetical protein